MYIDEIFDMVCVFVFLIIALFLAIFYLQMRLNTEVVTTIATRQTLQMDEIKSKLDQGYNKKEDLMSSKDMSGQLQFLNASERTSDGKVVFKSGGKDISGLGTDSKMKRADDSKQLKYGQPYAITNKQFFRWDTVLNSKPIRMEIYEARTGVNRGNFGEGYVYQGENRHVERAYQK